MARNGFFDCMIVSNGRSSCRASDLYTSRDTINKPKMSHVDRTEAQVYATGNKWQIENYEATHK